MIIVCDIIILLLHINCFQMAELVDALVSNTNGIIQCRFGLALGTLTVEIYGFFIIKIYVYLNFQYFCITFDIKLYKFVL